MSKYTVGVLGLDGLYEDYLTRMIESGYTPTLKHFLSHSYTYTLRALEPVPPLTSTSWTSILTGVNPGKHGIPGFCDRNGKLVTAEQLEHPRISEVLAFNNEESVLINPIPDYPLYTINKCHMLSHGFFTAKPLCNSDLLRKYLKDAPSLDMKYLYHDCRVITPLREFYEYYLHIVEDLVASMKPTLLWLNIDHPDHYLHRCPKIILDYKGAKIHPDEASIMKIIDKIVRLFLDNFDFMVIVSDHGFSAYSKVVYINSFLRSKDYIKTTRNVERALVPPRFVEYADKHVIKVRVGHGVYRAIKALHLKGLLCKALKLLGKMNINVRVEKRIFIDRFRSKVYMPSKGYMGLVVKDRQLVDQVIRELKELEGILLVKRNTEYAWGPYNSRLPDIVVMPNFFKGYIISDEVDRDTIVEDRFTVWHHPDGVFIIGPSQRLQEADMHPLEKGGFIQPYTVTNTILPLLGIPISHIADGVEDAKRILGKNIEIKRQNYIAKWKIIKRIRGIRRA